MGLTGYMAAGIVALLLLLGISGWLLKNSYEANGALKAAASINEAQVAKATKQIEDLIRKREELQTGLIAMGNENNALAQEKDEAIARYNSFRANLDNRTLANPAAIERAAKMNIRKRQCDLWEKTGGIGKCPVH